MSIMSGILMGVCVWLIVFFLVVATRSRYSATLGRKILVTTAFTLPVTAVVVALLIHYPIDLRLSPDDPAYRRVATS